jgi:lipid-binding SYLF domain-containing protein
MRIFGVRLTTICALSACLLLASSLFPAASHAATAQQIDASANATLARLTSRYPNARATLRDAKGVLVFPSVVRAAIGVGGEYGEGVLRVGGRSVGYYSIAGGSWGLQFGAQSQSVVIAFMTNQTLQHFEAKARSGKYWQAGIDGSVALLNAGGQAGVNTTTADSPVVGYVFNQQGLMYSLSLNGAKISQIKR